MAHVTFTKPRPRVLERRDTIRKAQKALREAQAAVRARDGGKCRVCRKPGNQAHHIVYRSHGGLDVPANLIYVCQDCHQDLHGHVVLVTFDPANPAATITFTQNTQWGE